MKHPPFKIFQIYHAVFLHYTSDYDYFKYNGKTAYKENTFEHRKDKYSFHKLSRELEHFDIDTVEYYFAWMFYNQESWVTPRTLCENVINFDLNWTNYGVNRVNNFVADIKKCKNLESKNVFELLNCGEIHWAFLLIMEDLINLIAKMNNELKGQYLWDSKYQKLIKFKLFYRKHEPMNEDMFRSLIPENFK